MCDVKHSRPDAPFSSGPGLRLWAFWDEPYCPFRDSSNDEGGRTEWRPNATPSADLLSTPAHPLAYQSLRESTVRESTVRESTVRESTVRESTIHESTVRESSERESSERECSARRLVRLRVAHSQEDRAGVKKAGGDSETEMPSCLAEYPDVRRGCRWRRFDWMEIDLDGPMEGAEGAAGGSASNERRRYNLRLGD